jgi:excisionase family DNA binding protein
MKGRRWQLRTIKTPRIDRSCSMHGHQLRFMQKRLLNIQEASEYLGFAVHTIYGWTSQRQIPFVKIGGRLRFDKRKLDRWIEQNEREVVDVEKLARRR